MGGALIPAMIVRSVDTRRGPTISVTVIEFVISFVLEAGRRAIAAAAVRSRSTTRKSMRMLPIVSDRV